MNQAFYEFAFLQYKTNVKTRNECHKPRLPFFKYYRISE